MNVDIKTSCNGDGYWSCRPTRRVRIFKIHLGGHSDNSGELAAFFDKEDWNIDKDGLIYTDAGWLRSFHWGLRKYGFSWKAIHSVDYSEQGMQGDGYVSMDAGKSFVDEYKQISRQHKHST